MEEISRDVRSGETTTMNHANFVFMRHSHVCSYVEYYLVLRDVIFTNVLELDKEEEATSVSKETATTIPSVFVFLTKMA